MSDQPQKKPGSLRDRIAAFEKSSAASAQLPPPPRPKPAGFATWKPKQPSPPSSPGLVSTDHAPATSPGMSASDARESITKGASLKERMAALQNKGAFGAPPPVAPKPVVERPKWKPPPVVHAPDPDNASDNAAGGIAAAIEKTITPTRQESEGKAVENVENQNVAHPTDTTTEGSETNANDERQRRAAIAARMARLGGARLGMAPPIISKKPLASRQSTQEEQEMAVEGTKYQSNTDIQSGSAAQPEPTKSPSIEPDSVAPLSPDSEDSLPSRKNTESEISGPKHPTSMPVPAVPRRTGPPRKKSAKATVPSPEIPKEEPPIPTSSIDKAEETAFLQPNQSIIEHEPVDDQNDGGHVLIASPRKSEPEDESKAVLTISEAPYSAAGFSGEARALESRPSEIQSPSTATENVSRAGVVEDDPEVESTPTHDIALEEDEADTDGSMYEESVTENLEVPVTSHNAADSGLANLEDDIHPADDADDNVDLDFPSTHLSDQSSPSVLTGPSVDPLSSDSRRVDVPSAPQRPFQQSRMIIPLALEDEEEERSDEEADEHLAQSHLFIPPPKERVSSHPWRKNLQDEDDGAGDGSENDTPALPVPHRRSTEPSASRSVPISRSDNDSDTDSDHDGQPLPVPPRPPPTRDMPPIPSEDLSQHESGFDAMPPSFSLDTEVMDEDEGDPIDPVFHTPSRRASYMSLTATTAAVSQPSSLLVPQAPSSSLPGSPSQPVSPPFHHIPPPARKLPQPSEDNARKYEEEDVRSERQTIAERMARLGGIKLGAAPLPIRQSAASAPRQEQADETAAPLDEEGEHGDDMDEEEVEMERKERIAAKLAQMGGMRIGMMPMGMGGVTQRTKPQEAPKLMDHAPPDPPSRPAPLAPPREFESASGDVSDDGVKVEAEESEVEEVDHQDAEPEEVPPPIPSRSTRPARRQDSSGTPASPPVPPSRPPIPVVPPRRSSTQFSLTGSTGLVSPQKNNSIPVTQTDYVMVEPTETRDTVRPAGPPRHIHDVSKMTESHESISQWELPSIPTPNLDLGNSTDLSLSWTDAGGSASPNIPSQPSTLRASKKSPGTDKSMSADDLIAVWGRVGVQVCEMATALFEKSRKSLIGDGTYPGFVRAVLEEVPNAAEVDIDAGKYGYLVYYQNGSIVQRRASEIMPGDIIEVHDARFKGHKGLQTYQQSVGGSGELVIGIVGEFEGKKLKLKVFQANQHVGQQTVESVSYRLEDLKSGTVKIYRVLEA